MTQPATETEVARRRFGWRRTAVIVGAVIVIVVGVAGVAGASYYSDVRLPEELNLPQRTTIYYSDGKTVMARLGEQNRSIIDTKKLPEYVRWAVVAAEDPTFYDRSGDDVSGMANGGWHKVFGGASHPNITQQFARLSTGSDDELRTSVVASKLEKEFSRDDILDFYLNTVYFGRSGYGIEAGAEAYFGKPAQNLSLAEALLLAGVLRSPGGEFDPGTNALAARGRWEAVRDAMVDMGKLPPAEAAAVQFPLFTKYEPAEAQVPAGPTGLIVRRVLSELRQSEVFRGKPSGYLENGGFEIVTSVDVAVQQAVESAADETSAQSLLFGQPKNLQAAVVVTEAGTGRVKGYFGGHDGAGSDYAGASLDQDGGVAHPPGATMYPYVLATALKEGISLKSRWRPGTPQEFPASGRTGPMAVRNSSTAPCVPVCTLLEATSASLTTPIYALTERLGAAKVIDLAKNAGIDSMWATGPSSPTPQRVDLRSVRGSDVAPKYFGTEVGIGQYPVTVFDQANGMATFAASGKRADAHFVMTVHRQGRLVYGERISARDLGLSAGVLSDLDAALGRGTFAKLPDGRASAGKTGIWQYGSSLTEVGDAWLVGYTRQLGAAVWVGNKADPRPLRLTNGQHVYGSGVPADIFRKVMTAAHANLAKVPFAPPANTGDDSLGNAGGTPGQRAPIRFGTPFPDGRVTARGAGFTPRGLL